MSCILFVDDDYLTLETYQKIFALFGHQVLLAESGEKALEFVKKHALDLIVLDMRLPEMDGFELLKSLKSDPATREITVVMVSAYPDLYAEHAIEAGAQYYMSKPIVPDKLLEILEQSSVL
jgi:CheY-like chemotaxis protein